jgi:hypothetical protein
MFLKYELLDSNTLILSHIYYKPVIEAIKSGKLKGDITYKKTVTVEENKKKEMPENNDKFIDYVKITDNSSNIINFFQSTDSKKVFTKPIRFTRIK